MLPLDMKYKPLSFMKSEIRLLKLHKSEDESAIVSCSLETVSLTKPIPYTALSYCWGESDVTCEILIDGVSVQVTTNLEAALYRLRKEKVEWLWADAICINQSDAEEKSLQVMRMNLIYRKATKVIVWLGTEDQDTDQAVQLVEHFSETDFPAGIDIQSLLMLTSLFGRPYWKRVWIIQEISVAINIEVYCGKYSISWGKLMNAAETYASSSSAIQGATCGSVCYSNDYLSVITLHKFRSNTLGRHPICLLDALYDSQQSLATDPRDRIFAVLGLSYDASAYLPLPSYFQSLSETFRTMAHSIISTSQSLDIIWLKPSVLSKEVITPSWIPNWLELHDGTCRRQIDQLGQNSTTLHRSWGFTSASEKQAAHFTFENDVLKAKGLFVGTVDGLSDAMHETTERAMNGVTQSTTRKNCYITESGSFDALSMNFIDVEILGKFYSNGVFRSLWQTENYIAIAETPSKHLLLDWLARNRGFMFQGRNLEDWSQFGVQHRQESEDERKYWADYLKYTFTCVLRLLQKEMRLMVTEEGHIGWAHPNTLKGDRIYLLFGSRMPVVLREHEDGFMVVGDAYVQGIMKSELVNNWDPEMSAFKSEFGEHKPVEVSIY